MESKIKILLNLLEKYFHLIWNEIYSVFSLKIHVYFSICSSSMTLYMSNFAFLPQQPNKSNSNQFHIFYIFPSSFIKICSLINYRYSVGSHTVPLQFISKILLYMHFDGSTFFEI